MTIIVDASIIISALINPSGKEASIIFNHFEKVHFVAPDLMYEEVLSKKIKSFIFHTLPNLHLHNPFF